MLLLADLAVPTLALPLPAVPATLVAAVLAMVAGLGCGMAWLAHVAWRDGSDVAWRRLRFLGLATVAAAGLEALDLGLGGGAGRSVVLAAGFTVLELAILMLALAALTRIRQGQPSQWPQLAVLGLVLLAIFCGLVGGAEPRSLLLRNLGAASAYVAALVGFLLALAHELIGDLRSQRTELRERHGELTAVQTRLAAAAATADRERTAADGLARRERERRETTLAGNRILEHIIVAAGRFNTVRVLPEILQQVAESTGEVFGFAHVVLHVYSDATQSFEPRAYVGVEEAERSAELSGAPVDLDTYRRLTQDHRRLGGCYLVDRAAFDPAVSPPATPSPDPRGGPWRDDVRLLVPLVSPSREIRGFLALAAPRDGRVPDAVRVRYLEILARLATGAIETVEAHDRLARNNAELAAVSEKLGSLGEMKSNFLANVSHELRTPLTSIMGYAELLRRTGEETAPDVRQEFLRVIGEEAEKLSAVIEDLLQLDRMEDGQARLDRQRTDLVGLVRRMGESWQEEAREKGLTFSIAASSEEILLEVDLVLCQQLLGHLVGNAMKFTPAGGRVRLNLAEQGTAVRLEVEDTGIGIPEAALPLVFDHFYQVDDSATREHNGQGVGLTICRDIVSYHDGRIWAENVRPRGTRFTVLLPRRAPVAVPALPPAPTPDFGDPRRFLQRLLHWVGEAMGVELVSLMTPEPGGEHLVVRAALGLPASVVQTTRLRRGAGYAGRAWASGRTLLIEDVKADPLLPESQERSRYSTSSLLVVPLRGDDGVGGVVMVNNRLDGQPLDQDDRVLLEALSPRIAYLLERFDAHQTAAREFAEIQEALRATTAVGRLRHQDVAAVCRRVALATARRLRLPEPELRHLAFALQHYDAGLGSVPRHLLAEDRPLDDRERLMVEKHVQAGVATLAPLAPPARVRQMILHHHEAFDGSGYPSGLAGEAIPLGARLIALTDSLRALLQNRPYRPAVALDDALAELRTLAGTRYCPRLTEIFVEEAARCADLVAQLRETADDGEDLKRPAPVHPGAPVRV